MGLILIRCDAGGVDGMGHVSRMSALAQELVRRGHAVQWLTTTRVVRGLVSAAKGALGSVYLYNPNASEYYILDEAVNHVFAHARPTLILDKKTYYARELLDSIKGRCRIMRIDHPHASPDSADWLVLPNMHTRQRTLEGLQESWGERIFYGPNYTLLSPDVCALAPWPYRKREDHVVFCAGGSNTAALQTLFEMSIDLDLGDALKVYAMGTLMEPLRVDRLLSGEAIVAGFVPDLLGRAKLVVGAFGVTAYECMYFGTPMIMVGHSAENAQAADELDDQTDGILASLGSLTELSTERLHQEIQRVLGSTPVNGAVASMILREQIDGHAATRIADLLE